MDVSKVQSPQEHRLAQQSLPRSFSLAELCKQGCHHPSLERPPACSDREQEDRSDEPSDSDSDMSICSNMSIDLEEESNVSSEPWSDIDLGAYVATTLRLLRSINISTISDRLYYYYQEGYLLSAVKQVYERRNTELLEGLRGKAIDLAGDGCCVKKKLQAASWSGLCKELEVWIQPVTNHLYFCAMMGDCNVPLLVSMWLSLLNHVVNKHSGHGGPYDECLH
ncbi:hypothetical protein HPB47_014121 [Ixodes persulcatus]|uniref:Uncharacterized protein n=1 Tax=Ixodes persulcatus TaxID=34615 RepID=A0AC60QWS4_IXOPE|nr:hypothetical protein HPB47_014121 [Ixodes persulcatus]